MGRGPDVTSNREHYDSVVPIFTCFCGEGCESSSKNCQSGALHGECSNSTNLQEVLRFMPYRFYVGMIVLKRRNEQRRVDFVKVKLAKREKESRLRVRRSVLCFSNKMISFNAWMFRKRKGFYGLRGLSKTN